MLTRQFCSFIHTSHLSPARLPHVYLWRSRLPSYLLRTIFSTASAMAPSTQEKDSAKQGGHKDEDVEGEHNEWKFREPYKVHENDPNFKALYEGSCHCGRIQYQLSREKPLEAKYCHCSTCQVLHGKFISLLEMLIYVSDETQEHRFNGQLFSINPISILRMDIMT